MKMDKYFTEEEERTLFVTIDKVKGAIAERDWAWMYLLRHTGIRIGALAGLTIADARNGLATGRLELKAVHAKREQAHEVPLNKKAKIALRKLIRAVQERGYTASPEQALVMGRNNKGLSIRSFQSRMSHWVEMSGLNLKATPHWFRHTCAIRIMNQSTARNPLNIVSAAVNRIDAFFYQGRYYMTAGRVKIIARPIKIYRQQKYGI